MTLFYLLYKLLTILLFSLVSSEFLLFSSYTFFTRPTHFIFFAASASSVVLQEQGTSSVTMEIVGKMYYRTRKEGEMNKYSVFRLGPERKEGWVVIVFVAMEKIRAPVGQNIYHET